MLKLDKFYYCRCRCQSIDFPAVTLNDQINLPSATLENNKHSPVFIQNKTSNEKKHNLPPISTIREQRETKTPENNRVSISYHANVNFVTQ